MRELEFKEYRTTVKDSDGDEHESVVRAAVVTDDVATVKNSYGNNVAREIMTPTGARPVAVGDVVVETDRPGVYDHMTADGWESSGYKAGDSNASQNASEPLLAEDYDQERREETDPTPGVVTDPTPVQRDERVIAENGDDDVTTARQGRKLPGNDNS